MGRIRNKIKNIIIENIPLFIKEGIISKYQKRNLLHATKVNLENFSYSVEGEDRVLSCLLEFKKSGFYIDVGAHHPIRFSNTYLFYLKGWNGLNLDAMPGSMKLFEDIRPRDINLQIPISSKKQILKYYLFNEPALNTFSEIEAFEKNGLGYIKIINSLQMETYPLK